MRKVSHQGMDCGYQAVYKEVIEKVLHNNQSLIIILIGVYRDIWWQTTSDPATPLEVSDSLYQPLQRLLVSCKYLHNTYPQSSFLSMYKNISLGIEDWYWRNIITKNQFSPSGVEQLETDLRSGFWKIGKRLVNKPENYTRR
jgi:hypothetical protein